MTRAKTMKITHADQGRAQIVARIHESVPGTGYRALSATMRADGYDWATASVVHRLMRMNRDIAASKPTEPAASACAA